jgi:diguanylate cyclase (GGDEF)-like protein
LTLFSVCFAGIAAALALICAVSLAAADHNTAQLEHQWLEGTAMLGEIDYRISAFRLTETYRTLVADDESRQLADLLAAAQARDISELQAQYAALLAGQVSAAQLRPLRKDWSAYAAAHRAWVAADPYNKDKVPATYGSPLDLQYRSTDGAIDGLIAINRADARKRAAAVAHVTMITQMLAGLIGGGAVAAAVWAMFAIRRQVIEPLRAITAAMSRLAVGYHDVRVPGMNRTDEIGEMALACEAFRLNVLALEEAHAQTKAAEQRAHDLARHDALTGLPNRRVFSEELEHAVALARRGKSSFTLLLLDLDNFKKVNDLQGHHAGDAVLCEVAERLKRAQRKSDIVARLGGDEFAIIAAGESDMQAHREGAASMATRLIASIARPIPACEERVKIGASIGIILGREDVSDVNDLLREADIAMYEGKRGGRGTYRFFEQRMDDELLEKELMEKDLAEAIAADEIVPHYMPLVDLKSDRVHGFEALARWTHPTRGMVGPDVFVPMAESTGLIKAMTDSILRQVCRHARIWPGEISIAVNISACELKDIKLAGRILAILEAEDFPPRRLEIEITESALIGDIRAAKLIIAELREAGLMVSLDDFGTGYSSLNHLRELSFDKVKIDRSFVQAMQDDAANERFIDAILGLTSSLGLPTVAEGIESQAARFKLAAKGCRFGQGYLFGKAMPAQAVRQMLDQPAIVS